MDLTSEEFSMRRLSAKQIVCRRWQLVALMVITVVIGGLGLFEYGMHHPLAIPPFIVPVDSQSLLGYTADCFLCVIPISFLVFSLPLANTFWLSTRALQESGRLCAEHPGLRHYRNLVMASGRRLTVGEFDAMESWVARRASAERLKTKPILERRA